MYTYVVLNRPKVPFVFVSTEAESQRVWPGRDITKKDLKPYASYVLVTFEIPPHVFSSIDLEPRLKDVGICIQGIGQDRSLVWK